MTSIIRSAATAGAAFVLVAGLATGGIALAAPAIAAGAPAASDPTTATTTAPSASAAASAAATATPTSGSTSGSTTSGSSTSGSTTTGGTTSGSTTTGTSTATPSASATSTATPSTDTDTATTQDPTLAEQNAAGNHAMGSTIPASDPAAAPATPKVNSLLKSNAVVTHAWPAGIKGLDVSAYQTGINWKTLYSQGARFTYVKATEGTTYQSSQFASQYNGAYAAGLTRGAYVFATPNTSTGAAQAKYFVAHGGGWSADGRTLPPLLDIEYGYNGTCWGLSQTAMVKWIADFSNTVKSLTGTVPAIYTTTNWWTTCTNNSKAFSANPFFVAQYPSSTTSASKPASLGASWAKWTFWQWSSTGPFPGDSDVFNGTQASLTLLAKGGGTAVATPAANAAATLTSGKKLTSGQSVTSSNKQYVLSMQSDGNLVLRGNGRAIWQTATPNNAGGWVAMQTDGNLVVYSKASKALWQSGTSNAGSSAKLVLQSNGDLQVLSVNGVQWRNGAPGSSSITAGTKLSATQFLHDSTGLIQTIMQSDGNFVVYIGGKAKFNTKTNGLKGSTITLQTDGNLVLRDSAGKVRWLTKTSTAGAGCTLTMQDDGNLVLRNKKGAAVWSSKTHV